MCPCCRVMWHHTPEMRVGAGALPRRQPWLAPSSLQRLQHSVQGWVRVNAVRAVQQVLHVFTKNVCQRHPASTADTRISIQQSTRSCTRSSDWCVGVIRIAQLKRGCQSQQSTRSCTTTPRTSNTFPGVTAPASTANMWFVKHSSRTSVPTTPCKVVTGAVG